MAAERARVPGQQQEPERAQPLFPAGRRPEPHSEPEPYSGPEQEQSRAQGCWTARAQEPPHSGLQASMPERDFRW